MSGRKERTVSMTESAVARLRQQSQAAVRLQSENRDLQALNRHQAETARRAEQHRADMQRRMETLHRRMDQQATANRKEVESLQTQLRTTVEDSNRQIQSMRQSFSHELGETRAEMSANLEAHRRQVAATISANNKRVERRLQEVSGRMDTVEADIATINRGNDTLLAMAQTYQSSADLLVEDIQSYRVEILCPGALAPLLALQQTANNDIALSQNNPNNASVARNNARQAWESALRLREQVLEAEGLWEAQQVQAQAVLEEVGLRLNESGNYFLPDPGGDLPVDVDHWTYGGLTALQGRLEACRTRLARRDITVDDMLQVVSAMEQINCEREDATTFAAVAMCESQNRADIAQDIYDGLFESLGMSVADFAYQGEDDRLGHRLHLKNPATGFEVVITSTPTVNETGMVVNRVESDVLDYGNTNDMAAGDDLARAVMSRFEELGLAQSSLRTEPGYERSVSNRTERRNIQAFRTETAHQGPRPQAGTTHTATN